MRINKLLIDQHLNLETIKNFNPDTYAKLLPFNEDGDLIYSMLLFVWRHNRFPSDKMLFNDYLFRMKRDRLCDSPIRKFISDKEYVKLFIAGVVGDRYNIPTLGIVSSKDDLLSYKHKIGSIIKPTHASGQAVMVNSLPVELNSFLWWFDIDYYNFGRELNYKGLDRKVIIEPLVFNSNNPADYKIFCYKGVPRAVQVDSDRFIKHRRDLYDRSWNLLDITFGHPRTDSGTPRPNNLSEMLDVASALSKHFEFIRVDIYSDGENCFVGELTNVHDNACGIFDSLESESKFSELLFQ